MRGKVYRCCAGVSVGMVVNITCKIQHGWQVINNSGKSYKSYSILSNIFNLCQYPCTCYSQHPFSTATIIYFCSDKTIISTLNISQVMGQSHTHCQNDCILKSLTSFESLIRKTQLGLVVSQEMDPQTFNS